MHQEELGMTRLSVNNELDPDAKKNEKWLQNTWNIVYESYELFSWYLNGVLGPFWMTSPVPIAYVYNKIYLV